MRITKHGSFFMQTVILTFHKTKDLYLSMNEFLCTFEIKSTKNFCHQQIQTIVH